MNAVSGSLICQPDFRSGKDATRVALVTMSQKVICYDPEFVLKVSNKHICIGLKEGPQGISSLVQKIKYFFLSFFKKLLTINLDKNIQILNDNI